jgi:hypothetical protein
MSVHSYVRLRCPLEEAIYASGPWTVFEELSNGLERAGSSSLRTETWCMPAIMTASLTGS